MRRVRIVCALPQDDPCAITKGLAQPCDAALLPIGGSRGAQHQLGRCDEFPYPRDAFAGGRIWALGTSEFARHGGAGRRAEEGIGFPKGFFDSD